MSRVKNSLTPNGNNNLNFLLPRDQVVHLETPPHSKLPLEMMACLLALVPFTIVKLLWILGTSKSNLKIFTESFNICGV